jgi:TRAP-type C4-dicarboxylate transport system substrate-binding protein
MARFRRPGAIGIALTTWELWRRLPPEYRRQILRAAREHAPRLLAEVKRRREAFAKRR